jgi:hypothetical protein
MSYHKGGILELHTKNDVKISTNLIINKKSNKGHLLQEPAVIYDIPAGTYFYNSYQQSTVKTGNALTLISNDNSSNTFLNITTPNKQGAAFGGGMYPYDVSRNMAIIGVLDASGALTPHQIIVSGISSVRAKSTVGFNTFAPITETYVVNINGPTRITNGEITTIVEPYIQVNKIGYPKNKLYQNQICVVGTPYPDPTSQSNNLYYVWNSTTGGTSWTQPVLKDINDNQNKIPEILVQFTRGLLIFKPKYLVQYVILLKLYISCFKGDLKAVIFKSKNLLPPGTLSRF